ncbi:MAG: ester cyclase [Armatimonadota bacterium]|nr:ester cyclase [Armatimonadota bacterium]MDR7444681.1 ester cyclase [Armatimonadota bacterium]MDR7571040.1 ester cyclase [Armatimonadota bacterium]MDR7613610.1 ester cyclase [Armatimonadota bacterium]
MSDATGTMREYLEAVSRRDFEGIRRLLHPKYSYAGSDGQRLDGPEAGVAVARMYTAAFPDLTLDVTRMHAVGDSVVVTEFTARGTHRGELMGVAPTGRRIEVPVCNVVDVQDGKILAEREYFDTGLLHQQLGLAGRTA